MFTTKSAVLSRYINRIVTDMGTTLGAAFNPLLNEVIRGIFRNGEQGFFYDPSDMSSVYESSVGEKTAYTGSPAGLFLDKSKQLKTKEFTYTRDAVSINQGGLSTVTVNQGASPADDVYTIKAVDNNVSFSLKGVGNRKVVLMTFEILAVRSGGVYFSPSSGIAKTYLEKGIYKTLVYLNSASSALSFVRSTVPSDVDLRIISIHEVLGNHAYQETTAARPLFRQKPILGSELVVNGDFSNGTTGWSSGQQASLSVMNGVLRVTNDAVTPSYGYAWTSFPTTVGKKYYVTARRIAGSENRTQNIHIGTGSASSLVSNILANADANKPWLFTATTTTTYIGLNAQSNALSGWMEYDDISIKELLGYRTDQNYIEYDGADDKLITNLPSALTNCTVLRAIPDVGTQVKYNQTLPMLYEDSTNHAGLLAINRALTRKEQLRLMTEFDKKAGVTSLEDSVDKLFDDNQEGFVYDPNDLSTMYQDAAGTVPVTAVGQPVGLMLDKSKGLVLSEELVANVNFNNGWVTVSSTITSANSFSVSSLQGGVRNNVFEIGKSYEISVGYTTSQSDVSLELRNGTSAAGALISKGLGPTATITAHLINAASTSLYLRTTYPTDITVTSISVKELAGSHAYQTTSASRPILRQNAVTGAYYLSFDGVDDFMVTVPLNLTGKKELTIHVGVLALPTAKVYEYLLANGNNTSDAGLIRVRLIDPSTQKFEINTGATYVPVDGPSAATRPEKRVLCAKFNSNSPYHSFTVNSVTAERVVPVTKDTTLTTLPMYIGRQPSNSWNATMELYGLTIVSAITSEDFDRKTKLDYENKMGI